MRFSVIFFPLALLASLTLATPIEERDVSTAVEVNAPEPKFDTGDAHLVPGTSANVEGGGGGGKTEVKQPVSKRSDYNELDGRSTVYFVACTYRGCGGCTAYYLSRPGCYSTKTYLSAYVISDGGLPYGVYASLNCRGLFCNLLCLLLS